MKEYYIELTRAGNPQEKKTSRSLLDAETVRTAKAWKAKGIQDKNGMILTQFYEIK